MTTDTADAVERDSAEAPAPISTAVEQFSPITRDLAQLKHQLGGVVYDLTTKAGEEAARRDRKLCVSMRGVLEDAKKVAKADLLRRTRAIDADYKAILAAIEEVEEPIDQQIKAVEAEREAERQRKAQEIAARMAAVRLRIVEAFVVREPTEGRATSAHLLAERERMSAIDCAGFGDLQPEAEETRRMTLVRLDERIKAALAHEDQARELAEQRRQAEEERKRNEAERVRLEAQQAEQRRLEAERLEAERRRIDAANKQLADERAAFEREQAAARAAADAAEAQRQAEVRAAAEKAEADRRAAAEKAEADRVAAERAQREREAAEAAERLAELQRQERVARLAPAMLDTLLAWQRAEAMPAGDERDGSLAEARMMRDSLLAADAAAAP